ncbi:MAG: DsbA family protein [Candidatus Microthrix parvicella]|jgi:2-hydroxychromene-2-carboxylate isomerase|nr:DsbA family protein [Candidatus Microthrix sp.]MBK7021425.1 DsbA family protein [Candidatus Microthrix sp.]
MTEALPSNRIPTNAAPAGTQTSSGPSPTRVDFHFDVLCPYAYQTSKWIRSVRDQLGITIDWRFFSLEEINRVEGRKHPWEREWSYGWSIMRIGALLRRRSNDDLARWYERTGRALHEEGQRPHDPAVARHLLAELGLEPGMVDEALADPSTNDEVRADHDRVVGSGGYGVPTLFFDDAGLGERCLFGPVLINPPTGEAAVRLWHAVTAWCEFPDVFELQQPKTTADEVRIAETFKPYLEARDWVSINRGKVIGFTEDGFTAERNADGSALSAG